jgi:hypothetical protein
MYLSIYIVAEEHATCQNQYSVGCVGFETFNCIFCDASDAAMQKTEVITHRIGRPIMLNTVALQYTIVDNRKIQEKANT